MLRAAVVGIVVVSFASTAPAPAAPKRADSCDAVRKREADLVKRLDASEKHVAQLKADLAAINAQLAEEIRRLEEERRKLNAKLK